MRTAIQAAPPGRTPQVAPTAPPKPGEEPPPSPHDEEMLDQALDETFPASDPVGSNRIA